MFYRDSARGRYMPVPFDLSKPEALVKRPAPGLYKVEFNLIDGFYLSDVQMPPKPPRLYGKVKRNADLVWTSFERLGRSAALFSGLKGTGKSLTVMHIAETAIAHSVPVVLIDHPHHGPGFARFMAELDRVVVIIDEFEKVYADNDDKPQEKMLSMLDGPTAVGDKLYLLTINDTWLLNKNLINRPGRIRYHFRFGKLSPAEVVEFCEFNLERPDLIPYLATLSKHTVRFSYDLLSKLVDELNHRPSMSVDDLIEVFNIESENSVLPYYLHSFSAEGVDTARLKVETKSATVNLTKPSLKPYVSVIGERYSGEHLEDVERSFSSDFSELTVTGVYYNNGNKAGTDKPVRMTLVYRAETEQPRAGHWSRRSLEQFEPEED